MNNFKAQILKIILKQPITVMDLASTTNCAAKTVHKYVEEFKKEKKISYRKSKFTILHNPELESKKVDFFQILLNTTVSTVLQIMLHLPELTQQELSKITGKSLPSISRALRVLSTNEIVKITCSAPGKPWSIKNKLEIISLMKEIHPKMIDQMESNMVEMTP